MHQVLAIFREARVRWMIAYVELAGAAHWELGR